MKKALFLKLFLIFTMYGFGQNVGIGTQNPSSSAILELNSNSKGFLPPRMSDREKKLIQSPLPGLLIFNTSSNCLNFFDGTKWVELKGFITYPDSAVHCSVIAEVKDVVSPTGRIWMDRNLGASRVATSSNDEDAFGDLYQWGRYSDGHQCRNSSITSTLSSIDRPKNDFLL